MTAFALPDTAARLRGVRSSPVRDILALTAREGVISFAGGLPAPELFDGPGLSSAYAAGKAGVVGLTKALAKEWGQFKINVNAVAFGWIETRLTASKVADNTIEVGGERVQLGIPDQMRGMASMLIPLGRTGTPEEAAGGVFFLCSPWSNFVHGQVLNITGGQFTGMTT